MCIFKDKTSKEKIFKEMTSKEIYDLLNNSILHSMGKIEFELAGTKVTIKTTDTVGNSIQNWLGGWFHKNNIYYDEPENTQEFPDFYLSKENKLASMLEVKAFRYEASPAFDIANYESYVKSISEKPYRLFADYLIFGYSMDDNTGYIEIKKIWLKKIWEIAGSSERYALNTQVKKNVIYNIRPNGKFKTDQKGPFANKEQFLKAIYQTQEKYRGKESADAWKNEIKNSYRSYYGSDLNI